MASNIKSQNNFHLRSDWIQRHMRTHRRLRIRSRAGAIVRKRMGMRGGIERIRNRVGSGWRNKEEDLVLEKANRLTDQGVGARKEMGNGRLRNQNGALRWQGQDLERPRHLQAQAVIPARTVIREKDNISWLLQHPIRPNICRFTRA